VLKKTGKSFPHYHQYMSDYVAMKADGTMVIRGCVKRKNLLKPLTRKRSLIWSGRHGRCSRSSERECETVDRSDNTAASGFWSSYQDYLTFRKEKQVYYPHFIPHVL